MLMPELSNEALRIAMENGTFFACSRIAKNEMGDEFEGTGEYAKIERINVDEEQDIITVTANNYETIEWISDGEIIATGNTFNLRENSEIVMCDQICDIQLDGNTYSFIYNE